jgi:hypothetical protein
MKYFYKIYLTGFRLSISFYTNTFNTVDEAVLSNSSEIYREVNCYKSGSGEKPAKGESFCGF